MACLGQSGDDEVAHGRKRPLARPPVGDELDQADGLPHLDVGGNRHAANLGRALGSRLRPVGAVDDVIHARSHPQTTALRRMHEHDPRVVVGELLRLEWRLERRRGSRVGRLRRRGLVRDQLGLHDDAQRSVHRLDLVKDGRDRPLGERDEARRADADRRAGG